MEADGAGLGVQELGKEHAEWTTGLGAACRGTGLLVPQSSSLHTNDNLVFLEWGAGQHGRGLQRDWVAAAGQERPPVPLPVEPVEPKS